MPERQLPARREPTDPLPDARERVVETLTRLFAEDRISEAELEARLERVYRADPGPELDAILADLQVAPPAAESTAVLAAGGEETRVRAFLSAVERQWAGTVPRQLAVRGRLGYVELDMTGATFEPGVTVIDVRAFMGYVQIRFPAGVRVECHGHAFAGFFTLKGAGSAAADAPVVRIVGRASFGFAECSVASGAAARLPGPAA